MSVKKKRKNKARRPNMQQGKSVGKRCRNTNVQGKTRNPEKPAEDGVKAICTALINGGQYKAAEARLLPELEKDPDNTDALNLMGLCCLRTKQLDRAASCFHRIVELDPEAIVAHNNLGTVYKVSNQLDKAEKVFGLCLEKDAENKHALLQLADIKRLKQHVREAIDLYDQALELYPEDPVYLNNLGVIYQNLGLLNKSMDCFRRAFQSDPDKTAAYNNFLLSLNYLHTYDGEKMTPETLLREHEKWGKTRSLTPNTGPQHFARARVRDKKIKLAYLSQDFWRHSVSYFFEPVIESHDKQQFEIYCYADISKPDQVTKRIQSHADVWKNINGWSSQSVAEQIRRDQIDILVELGGHTAPNLLQVCTLKPAPVQVTWIGYPATTGLSAMDYRFTDETADPSGEADNCHTERLVRLPECFLCYRPIDDAPPIMPYLSKNWQGITFTSFNKITKISDKTAELWAAILNRLPDARLFLKSKGLDDPETIKRYLDLFEQHGISKDRIILKSWFPSIHASLDAYNTVDIALDTFPYNGTTTTCEAFWMGVPVITLRGDRHAARVSASLLTSIGLEELIAESEEEYVEKAVALARDRFRLQKYRSTTRQMMQKSSLCDKQGHTRKVEAAFRKMWEAYCDYPEAFIPKKRDHNGLPPEIHVDNFSVIYQQDIENQGSDSKSTISTPTNCSNTKFSSNNAIFNKPTASAANNQKSQTPTHSEGVELNHNNINGLKLHIGGRTTKKDWQILNIFPGEGVDYVGDIKDLSGFSTNICSEIYASHVLEHVSQRDILATLKDLQRILKPGGKLMISVPDLDILCRHFIDPKLNANQRFHVMRMIFGGQTNEHDFHYIGLNFDFLRSYLKKAGFAGIKKVKDFGLFDDTSTFAPYGKNISLNVIAYKNSINNKNESRKSLFNKAATFQGIRLNTGEARNICWIASYPKSGNTWMRFLIGNLLFDTINNTKVLETKIPDIHKHKYLNIAGEESAYLKTHWMYQDNMPGSNHISSTICIVRNPFDVLCSNINYLNADTPEKRHLLIEEFLAYEGVKKWIDFGFGTWSTHAESWLFQKNNFPVFFVRYEDLLEDCAFHMCRLCNFLNLKVNDNYIHNAVKASSFDQLKSMEEKEIAQRKPGLFLQQQRGKSANDFRFINKGQAGAFFDVLTPDQISRLNTRFEPMMNILGYKLDMKKQKIKLENPTIQHCYSEFW